MESTGTPPRRTARRRPTAATTAGPVAAPDGADPEQVAVDSEEGTAEARYQRHREFARLVAEAVRRAEAMTRLELALSLEPR